MLTTLRPLNKGGISTTYCLEKGVSKILTICDSTPSAAAHHYTVIPPCSLSWLSFWFHIDENMKSFRWASLTFKSNTSSRKETQVPRSQDSNNPSYPMALSFEINTITTFE